MINPTIVDIGAKIFAAHYAMQSNLYMSEKHRFSNFSIYTGTVDDPEWNHAVFHSFLPQKWEEDLERLKSFFKNKKKQLTIAVRSTKQNKPLHAFLNQKKWRPVFRHSTLLFQPKKVVPVEWVPKLKIRRVVNEKDMEQFIKVFVAVFLTGSGAENEQEKKKYSKALWDSFNKMKANPDNIFHYLASYEGIPVGTGTSLFTKDVSGLCNLAVLPKYRKSRIGEVLSKQRIIDAVELGYTHIFLQTEREVVKRWQCRQGFEFRFEVTGYSPPKFNNQ